MGNLIGTDFSRRATKLAVLAFAAFLTLSASQLQGNAAEPAPQTDASKAQIDKLVELWRKHKAGAHTLLERQSAFKELMAQAPEPTRVQTRHVDADGVEADLIWPARLHHPFGRRAILLIPGGGVSGGAPQTHRAFAGSLAKATSADVLLIEYRVMPDYQYPSQIDDALSAYRWLLEEGYKSENIVIAGDSFGGTIAIEATIRQVQAKRPLPAAVVAMSPITDLAVSGASVAGNAESDPLITKADLEGLRNVYAGDESPRDPQVSPLYAEFAGFPPLLMQVGSREILLDDTLRLADRARQAGVDTTAEVWPGMIHQWQLFPFWLDDADRANQRVADFAIAHFADKPQE